MNDTATNFRKIVGLLIMGRDPKDYFSGIEGAKLPTLLPSTKPGDRWAADYSKHYAKQLLGELGNDALMRRPATADSIDRLLTRLPGKEYGVSDADTYNFLRTCLGLASSAKATRTVADQSNTTPAQRLWQQHIESEDLDYVRRGGRH